jgi:hypothetical protein
MTRQILILLTVFVVFPQPNYAQVARNDSILYKIIIEEGQVEVTIPFPGKSETDRISRNVSIRSLKDKTLYIILSAPTVEWFIQQKFNYTIIEKPAPKGILTSENIIHAMEWESYPSFSQYDSIMRSFVLAYPSLCLLDTIGTSINGKLILALKISSNLMDEGDKPDVFYTSTMHGDETGGFILMLRLADFLLKNYAGDLRVKQLIDNLDIWINPLANPDGTYRMGNTIISPVRGNANGYDLNRNFPGSVPPNTLMQKETRDMILFMGKHKFVLSANFHSGTEVVNYPWDKWQRLHADDLWFYNISRKYADTAQLYSYPGYMTFENNGVTRGYEWYPIYGGRQDYVTYELQGREVTIELDNEYITPVTELNSLWNFNWRSLVGYLENALYGIHGKISDHYSAEPVSARIFITGHDKDSSHIFSDTTSGKFVRFLAPGSWDLSIQATGYRDTIIKNVTVMDGQKTYLDIEMIRDSSGKYKSPVLYPNPVSSELNIMLPADIAGMVNIVIYNLSGVKVSDYNDLAVNGLPVVRDVSNMAGGIYFITITNTVTKISYTTRFIVIRK